MSKIRVLVWNENYHEQVSEAIAAIYPRGIHTTIAEGLSTDPDLTVSTATMDMEEFGLSEEALAQTDVLIVWAHHRHGELPDEIATRVQQRVLDGMGFLVLHSAHLCKPFVRLMGTVCRSRWRENDEKERLWVIEQGHPIAEGLPAYLEFEEEETYGERFDIPTPDELVFISWFSGGEVFRSGCCFYRGKGKIFYFRPGHEAYPTYYREDVRRILINAVKWARPINGPAHAFGHHPVPLENIRIQDHSDEIHPTL
ncbi:MAG: trehalose utilization protein ThuA [Ruminococcaceae bacterium]|nr:trehalose utilization protein ThuA [Oscillospiraceae bacterium]